MFASVIAHFIFILGNVAASIYVLISCTVTQSADCGQTWFAFILPLGALQSIALIFFLTGLIVQIFKKNPQV